MEQLPLTLKASKPLPFSYPETPRTIGDHIRRRRMDLKLFQRDVANIIGVDEGTIHNWEMSHSYPQDKLILKIIEFIGYDPRNP